MTITIPPAALEAALEAANAEDPYYVSRIQIEAACLAMLRAWPGMSIEKFAPWSKDRIIHLPLPRKETSDE